MKKTVDPHLVLHVRIKVLTMQLIKRGEIISCDRQADDSYIIDRPGYLPTTFTAVGAGTLLYLLNSASMISSET